MTRNIAKAFSLLAVLAIVSAAGYAQQVNLKANVPFDFTVGKMTFPAGEYDIQRLSPDALLLSNRDIKRSTVVLPEPMFSNLGKSSASLKFERSEGRSALSEIWALSNGYKLSVPKNTLGVAKSATEITLEQAGLAPAK
jgi:hypothetical protein